MRGVAFDLDGTLYPNYRINTKLTPFFLKNLRLGIAFGLARKIIRKEQEISSFKYHNFYEYQAEIVLKILKKAGGNNHPKIDEAQKDETLAMKEKLDCLVYNGWQPIFKKVKLYKNVSETLAALKNSGIKLALLSDFPPQKKLEYLGISQFFDCVLCSEDFGYLKPHSTLFVKLAEAMSLPPEEILYVGNSLSYDIAGANRVGMKTALISSLFSPARKKHIIPDFVLYNYNELLKISVFKSSLSPII